MSSKRDELSGEYAYKVWRRVEVFDDVEGAYRAGWDARQPEIDQLVLALRKIAKDRVTYLSGYTDKNQLTHTAQTAAKALEDAGL